MDLNVYIDKLVLIPLPLKAAFVNKKFPGMDFILEENFFLLEPLHMKGKRLLISRHFKT